MFLACIFILTYVELESSQGDCPQRYRKLFDFTLDVLTWSRLVLFRGSLSYTSNLVNNNTVEKGASSGIPQ